MKKLLPILLLAALAIGGCKKDDTTTTPTQAVGPLVGTWLSEGSNVAIGLRSALKVKSVKVVMNADSTVTTQSTDSSNVVTSYTGGTYSLSAAATDTSIQSIVIKYTSPAITQSGIVQAKGTTMRLEVVQTTPQLTGVTAATVAGGFGSTKYNSVSLGVTYIQSYVKQ
jgi:hypothetical protein